MYRWQVVMAGCADSLFADQPSSSFSPGNYVPALQDVGEPEEGISCSGLRSWTINHALAVWKALQAECQHPCCLCGHRSSTAHAVNRLFMFRSLFVMSHFFRWWGNGNSHPNVDLAYQTANHNDSYLLSIIVCK